MDVWSVGPFDRRVKWKRTCEFVLVLQFSVCNVEASRTSAGTLGQSLTSSGYHKGQGCTRCVARRDSTAEGANRNSWQPGHVCLRVGSVLADMRNGQGRLVELETKGFDNKRRKRCGQQRKKQKEATGQDLSNYAIPPSCQDPSKRGRRLQLLR